MSNDVGEFQLDGSSAPGEIHVAPRQFPDLSRLHGSEHTGHLGLPLNLANFPPYPALKRSEPGNITYDDEDRND